MYLKTKRDRTPHFCCMNLNFFEEHLSCLGRISSARLCNAQSISLLVILGSGQELGKLYIRGTALLQTRLSASNLGVSGQRPLYNYIPGLPSLILNILPRCKIQINVHA